MYCFMTDDDELEGEETTMGKGGIDDLKSVQTANTKFSRKTIKSDIGFRFEPLPIADDLTNKAIAEIGNIHTIHTQSKYFF